MNLQVIGSWIVRSRYKLILLAIAGLFLAIWGANWFLVSWVLGDTAGILFGGRWFIRWVRTYPWEAALLLVLTGWMALWSFPAGWTIGLAVGYSALLAFIHIPLLIQGVRVGLVDVEREPLRLGAVVVTCILLAVWGMSVSGIALWALFLAWVLYHWESRVIAFLALASLISCPVLLVFHRDAWAETMAEYAYLFLVITVSLQIIEYWRGRKHISHEQA